MQSSQSVPLYRVWSDDHVAHGPFELPDLVAWVKQKKVAADSWILVQEARAWRRASEIPELRDFFGDSKPAPGSAAPARTSPRPAAVKPQNLRRIKIFADLEASQLESFLGYLEVVKVTKFTHLFRKGDHADAMYFLLEGEVRALTWIDGKETTLFTMRSGESFGELALVVQGPRSADMVANEDCVLLRLPAAAFEQIIVEAPALATPFLLAISRTIARRSVELGKKLERSIQSARVLAEVHF